MWSRVGSGRSGRPWCSTVSCERERQRCRLPRANRAPSSTSRRLARAVTSTESRCRPPGSPPPPTSRSRCRRDLEPRLVAAPASPVQLDERYSPRQDSDHGPIAPARTSHVRSLYERCRMSRGSRSRAAIDQGCRRADPDRTAGRPLHPPARPVPPDDLVARVASTSWAPVPKPRTCRARPLSPRSGRLTSASPPPSMAIQSRTEVADSLGKLDLAAPSSGLPLSTNLSRWRTPNGFAVTFGPGSAAPNGAGSVFFGDPGWGSRVVIRAESGITRRERQ